jgi:aminotransferase
VTIPTRASDGWEPSPERIARAITPRTKAILLSSPTNPTGAVTSRATVEKVAHLAEERDLLVISDEIYDRLVYGTEHVCVASLPNMRERTILLGGFSKDYAMTGWRIGYAAAPAPLLAQLAKIHQYTIMSAPTVGQFAALEALRSGEPHVEQMRQQYDKRRRLIVEGFRRLRLDCVEPLGAFYAFPSIANVSRSSPAARSDPVAQDTSVAPTPPPPRKSRRLCVASSGSSTGTRGEWFLYAFVPELHVTSYV